MDDEEDKRHKMDIENIIPYYLREDFRIRISNKFNEKLNSILSNTSIIKAIHNIIRSYCEFPTEFKVGDDWSCLISKISKVYNIKDYYEFERLLSTIAPDDPVLYLSFDKIMRETSMNLPPSYVSNLLFNGAPVIMKFEFFFDRYFEFGGANQHCFHAISKNEIEKVKLMYRFWRYLNPSLSTESFPFYFYIIEPDKPYVQITDIDKNFGNDMYNSASLWNHKSLVVGIHKQKNLFQKGQTSEYCRNLASLCFHLFLGSCYWSNRHV